MSTTKFEKVNINITKKYFECNKKNIKKFWKGVNNYLNKNKTNNIVPTMVKSGN